MLGAEGEQAKDGPKSFMEVKDLKFYFAGGEGLS